MWEVLDGGYIRAVFEIVCDKPRHLVSIQGWAMPPGVYIQNSNSNSFTCLKYLHGLTKFDPSYDNPRNAIPT